MSQKKVVIYQDEDKILSHRAKLEETLPLVQQAFDLFRQAQYYQETMGLADMLNSEHHRSVYKQKIFKGQEGKVATALGLEDVQISTAKVSDLIEIEDPPGFGHSVSVARQKIQQHGLNIKDFLVSKAGNVRVNRAALQAFEDLHSVLAETEDEIELHRLMMNYVESRENLDTFLREKTGTFLMAKPLYPVKISDYFRHDGLDYTIFAPRFTALKRAMKNFRY